MPVYLVAYDINESEEDDPLNNDLPSLDGPSEDADTRRGDFLTALKSEYRSCFELSESVYADSADATQDELFADLKGRLLPQDDLLVTPLVGPHRGQGTRFRVWYSPPRRRP